MKVFNSSMSSVKHQPDLYVVKPGDQAVRDVYDQFHAELIESADEEKRILAWILSILVVTICFILFRLFNFYL
jgi:hypothetical protein